MGSASPIVIVVGTDNKRTAQCYNKSGHDINEPDTTDDDVCGGGRAIINVGEGPARPKFLGCDGTTYTHDTFCTICGQRPFRQSSSLRTRTTPISPT